MRRFLAGVSVLGVLVALPAAALGGAPPPGATARCADGSYSFSQHHSGTCSHHGGVAAWLDGSGSSGATGSSGTSTPSGSAASPSTQRLSVRLAPRTRAAGCRAGILPDRRCSPGAYDPRVTQATIGRTICVAGYTARVRDVPESEKDAVYREYGILRHAPGSYEIDHVVSLELGGSNDIANLYPEAYRGANGARTKDALENRLHGAVCAHTLSLAAARHAIATNWLAAARRYDG